MFNTYLEPNLTAQDFSVEYARLLELGEAQEMTADDVHEYAVEALVSIDELIQLIDHMSSDSDLANSERAYWMNVIAHIETEEPAQADEVMEIISMTINDFELAALLTDDIHIARIVENYDDNSNSPVELQWGFNERVILEHVGSQTFFIVESNSDEMFPGETISVDEILDIVL